MYAFKIRLPTPYCVNINLLRGPGGGLSSVDFHFLIVSFEGECQLPGTVIGMVNIVLCQSYGIFKSRKYIQLHCVHEL